MKRLIPILLVGLAAGCGRDAELPRHSAFVPVVIRASGRRAVHWRTVVKLKAGPRPAAVLVGRWPPDRRESEQEHFSLAPFAETQIPSLVPPLPQVSSLYIGSDEPVAIEATIYGKSPDGDLPPLHVPVVSGEDLARPGDRLSVGPLVRNAAEDSHFCLTFPWTERHAIPFKVEFVFTARDGRELRRETRALPGVPLLVGDPWKEFNLPAEPEVRLTVAFLGSVRARSPRLGLWLYGITQEKRSRTSRFLETKVERRAAR